MKRLNIYCLNQDIHRFKDLQDEEIKYLLSESGYPGFKDLQDEEIKYLLSESGYPGFKDFQDEEIKYFQ